MPISGTSAGWTQSTLQVVMELSWVRSPRIFWLSAKAPKIKSMEGMTQRPAHYTWGTSCSNVFFHERKVQPRNISPRPDGWQKMFDNASTNHRIWPALDAHSIILAFHSVIMQSLNHGTPSSWLPVISHSFNPMILQSLTIQCFNDSIIWSCYQSLNHCYQSMHFNDCSIFCFTRTSWTAWRQVVTGSRVEDVTSQIEWVSSCRYKTG